MATPPVHEITDISTALSNHVRALFRHSLGKIEHCLAQLDENQLWWRPTPELNSIANLVLHLAGNARQWVISGIGGAPDVRDRPAEFTVRETLAKDEVLGRLRTTLTEVDTVLASITPDDWLAPRRIQGFEVTVLTATLDTASHFQGHTQEIISLTRQQLGTQYRFDFVPKTREQGAP